MDRYDVIVVGAGPAGSTTALYAARSGLRTLLIDKENFPRDKACGDLLPAACLEILSDLGLSHELEASRCCRVRCVVFSNENERLVLDGRNFVSVQRKSFDHLLFAAARECTDTLEGFRVEALLGTENHVSGIRAMAADGRELEATARVVVGADGYSSVVARSLRRRAQPERLALAVRGYARGVPMSRDEGHFYYFQSCSPGYLWAFPIGDDLANVGLYLFANDYKTRRRPLRALFEDLLRQGPLREWFSGAEFVEPLLSWSLPLAGECEPLHGNGVVVVGDAAGLVDPFWGHGIDSAMVSGRLAAATIARALERSDSAGSALRSYTDAVYEHFGTTWRERRALATQVRALNTLLGTTPLDHFRRWLGEADGVVEERRAISR